MAGRDAPSEAWKSSRRRAGTSTARPQTGRRRLDAALRHTLNPRLLAGAALFVNDCRRLLAFAAATTASFDVEAGQNSTTLIRRICDGLDRNSDRLLRRALLLVEAEAEEDAGVHAPWSTWSRAGISLTLLVVIGCTGLAAAGYVLAAAFALVGLLIASVTCFFGRRLQVQQQEAHTLRGELADLQRRVAAIEALPQDDEAEDERSIKLGRGRRAHESQLVAATLPRYRMPRLIHAMEDEPPARNVSDETSDVYASPGRADHVEFVATIDLLVREWHDAVHHRDLQRCRRLYAILADVAPYDLVAPLPAVLKTVASRVQKDLRTQFAELVRAEEFAEAIQVGEQLEELFPGTPTAKEFERLRPHLMRRVS